MLHQKDTWPRIIGDHLLNAFVFCMIILFIVFSGERCVLAIAKARCLHQGKTWVIDTVNTSIGKVQVEICQ